MDKEESVGVEITTELRLGLPGGVVVNNKRKFSQIDGDENSSSGDRRTTEKKKNEQVVVGWPPVCSYRKKNYSVSEGSKMYVKVSMDGAPFLRKIDLALHNGYSHLAFALEKLFTCYGIG
ncbi:PB1 domain [Sesbania bispinosa]|nr:PB1 domain [Sesbania bispinosa]